LTLRVQYFYDAEAYIKSYIRDYTQLKDRIDDLLAKNEKITKEKEAKELEYIQDSVSNLTPYDISGI